MPFSLICVVAIAIPLLGGDLPRDVDQVLRGVEADRVVRVPDVKAKGHLPWHDVGGTGLHGELAHRGDESSLAFGVVCDRLHEDAMRRQARPCDGPLAWCPHERPRP